jgi:hypothetical protein
MEITVRIRLILSALLIPLSPAAAQQDVAHAVASRPVDASVIGRYAGAGFQREAAHYLAEAVSPLKVAADRRAASLSTAGMIELSADRKLSITGGVVGAVVGAAAGVALACLANRGPYGEYCLGQSDTKLVIGGVIGAGVGGWIGAVLWARR